MSEGVGWRGRTEKFNEESMMKSTIISGGMLDSPSTTICVLTQSSSVVSANVIANVTVSFQPSKTVALLRLLLSSPLYADSVRPHSSPNCTDLVDFHT